MDLKNFIIDNVDRFLEYLKQNPLVIYARRSVDAYLAAYALAAALGETAQVSVVDWPPQAGVCVGFRCEGMYITEWGVGVDDRSFDAGFTSMSHLASVLIQSLSPLEEQIHRSLYAGHYSWSVDYCEYGCPPPREILKGDERLAVAFPFLEKLPARRALSLSTLPIVPGVTGKPAEDSKLASAMGPDEALALLDWALGVVHSEGFHTAVLDKALRLYSPAFAPADFATRVEADLAGFVGRDVELYVQNLADAFYGVVKRGREGVVPVQNPFYVLKIPPYLSYYLRLSGWAALRYDAGRGHVVALVPPRGERDRLAKAAELLGEVGQVLRFPTHLVAYVERDKYADFLKIYEKGFV